MLSSDQPWSQEVPKTGTVQWLDEWDNEVNDKFIKTNKQKNSNTHAVIMRKLETRSNSFACFCELGKNSVQETYSLV